MPNICKKERKKMKKMEKCLEIIVHDQKNQINEDFKVRTKSSFASPNPSFDHLPSRNFLMA